jgi:PAS domain S-box-containing protein
MSSNSKKILTVLVVEDRPDDAELVLIELRRAGYEPRWRRVDTEPAYLAALDEGYAPGEPWDLVLSDFQMPGFSGVRALNLLQARESNIPFILISGTIGEEFAVEALQGGAADYLLKGRLARLKTAVSNALEENRLRLETRAAERALRANEQRYRALIENSADGIGVVDRHSRLNYVSPASQRLLGLAPEQLLGRNPFEMVHPDDQPRVRALLNELRRTPGQTREVQYRLQHASGVWRTVHTSITNLLDDPSVAGLVFNYRDITAELEDELALRASGERYRGLFEGSPVALLEQDFSEVKQRLEQVRAQGHSDLVSYINARPEFVSECARLVKMLAINPRARRLYGAGRGDAFAAGFEALLANQVNAAFQTSLIKVAEGQTQFDFDAVQRTPAGEELYVHLRWSALPGYEDTLERVIVSALDISQRVRAEAELKRRVGELESINRVSVALRSAASQAEILARLARESIAILGGSAGSLWLVDETREHVYVAHAQGWDMRPEPFKLGTGLGLPALVVASGEPLLSDDLSQDERVPAGMRAYIPGGRSGLCVPIRAADEVMGALFVNIDAPRRFAPTDADLLTTLAEIAGNAIQRSRLYEQTEQQLNRITALRSVDQAISSSLDLRVTLTVLLDQATTHLRADAADVLLLNSHRQVLEYIVGRGQRGTEAQRLRVRLGQGRAGRAAYERRLVHVADLRAEAAGDPANALVSAEGFVAYYGVPLLAKGQIKGVLEIYHRQPLEVSQDWLEFLEALAGQAAIAIDNAALFDGLQRSNLELVLAYDATIAGWSHALDMRDHETGGHTERVTDQTVRLAAGLGMLEGELVHARRGALLHDIGNMGVPTNLLLKPGPLSAEEWAIVRQHPQFAFELLSPIAYLRPALDIPYGHHERWDGSGYPRGLAAEAIPLAARVFAVVDVWDAMLSDRPYRPALPREQALAYLREQAGKHFDPRVVAAFLKDEEVES